MNKQQVNKLVRQLNKKGATVYMSRYSLAEYLRVPPSKVTKHVYEKVRIAWLEYIVASNCRPAVEVLFAEEELGLISFPDDDQTPDNHDNQEREENTHA